MKTTLVRMTHVRVVVFLLLTTLLVVYALPTKVRQSESVYHDLIRTYGGDKAYSVFAGEIADDSPNTQHKKAHSFGRALYEVVGDGGISVCDDKFSYGCMHEFVGSALASNGLAYVSTLNTFCLHFSEKSHFCQHGLGHGLTSFYGYSSEDIFKALKVCAQLPRNDTVGGCRGGVFMEYNFQTMLESYATVRTPGQRDLKTPCHEFSGDDKTACMYWLPQWLKGSVYAEDSPQESVKKIEQVCYAAEKSLHRVCFEGLGNAFAIEERIEKSKRITLCDLLKNPDNQVFCRNSLKLR
jgi:preprotein translocase subunit SecG